MSATTPESSRQRAQLLTLALGAQRGMNPDPTAEHWYLKGTRDAYIYAAAVLATGRPGIPAGAATGRVTDLVNDGAQDVTDLMAALYPGPQAETRDRLTWIGPVAFHRLTSARVGIDHDLGTRWGAQHDIRLSHRRSHDGSDGSDGLLYAYDRTWDEYTILADTIDVDTVEAVVAAALALDPHLPVDRFPHLLHDVKGRQSADVAAPDLGPVL